MDNSYLLLWLEGPLQAWGADSKFGRRDTLPFPTKSGITGMLLCAMGATGEQEELLAALAPLGQTVVSYRRLEQRNDSTEKTTSMREPFLRDFHMVGSGYDDGNIWEALLIPKTSDGKKAVGGGTKITYRYYLQDARFAVVVEVPSLLADTMAEALRVPVYDIFLGRRNCAPTDLVYRGLFKTVDMALETANLIATEKNLVEEFRVLDGEHDGEVMTLNDVPTRFGPVKKYRDRRVSVVTHE